MLHWLQTQLLGDFPNVLPDKRTFMPYVQVKGIGYLVDLILTGYLCFWTNQIITNILSDNDTIDGLMIWIVFSVVASQILTEMSKVINLQIYRLVSLSREVIQQQVNCNCQRILYNTSPKGYSKIKRDCTVQRNVMTCASKMIDLPVKVTDVLLELVKVLQIVFLVSNVYQVMVDFCLTILVIVIVNHWSAWYSAQEKHAAAADQKLSEKLRNQTGYLESQVPVAIQEDKLDQVLEGMSEVQSKIFNLQSVSMDRLRYYHTVRGFWATGLNITFQLVFWSLLTTSSTSEILKAHTPMVGITMRMVSLTQTTNRYISEWADYVRARDKLHMVIQTNPKPFPKVDHPPATNVTLRLDYYQFNYGSDFQVILDYPIEFGVGKHVISGPNGSGKTTFFNTLTGYLDEDNLHPDTHGILFIDGQEYPLRRLEIPGTMAPMISYQKTNYTLHCRNKTFQQIIMRCHCQDDCTCQLSEEMLEAFKMFFPRFQPSDLVENAPEEPETPSTPEPQVSGWKKIWYFLFPPISDEATGFIFPHWTPPREISAGQSALLLFLIAYRKALNAQMAIFDEPGSNVDQDNIAKMSVLLDHLATRIPVLIATHQKSTNLGKNAVSHHMIDQGKFKKVQTV